MSIEEASGQNRPSSAVHTDGQADQGNHEAALLQLQQHVQQLAGQFDYMRQQMEEVHAESNQSNRRLATLIEQLTDSERAAPLLEQVAEMATVLDSAQTQLEELTRRTARQEQLERLVEVVAGQSQLDELNENLKKLTRTQFKSNTLGESKAGQVDQALTTLRALATQREEVQEQRTVRANQQLTDAHRAGRAEFAAELLPALDSLDLALTNGADLLARQQRRVEEALQRETLATIPVNATQSASTPAPGFWQRLFGATETVAEPAPPPPAPSAAPVLREFATATEQAISAWLKGLTLVSERFTSLLATEEIEPIEALHQPFDPKVHVAVETAVRNDVEPNTVVRVLRQGYRRRDRVIRYAEVVVARGTGSG